VACARAGAMLTQSDSDAAIITAMAASPRIYLLGSSFTPGAGS
jgi:DNA-binding NarL/FixJ family response regulator